MQPMYVAVKGDASIYAATRMVVLCNTVNHRANPLRRFPAEGLLAASDAHDSRNPADKDLLPINAEGLTRSSRPSSAWQNGQTGMSTPLPYPGPSRPASSDGESAEHVTGVVPIEAAEVEIGRVEAGTQAAA